MNKQALSQNFAFELNAFLDAVREFFSCDSQDQLTQAVTVAFKEGLDASQFRLSTYINLKVSQDKDIKESTGLFRSNVKHESMNGAFLNDSLFEFNSWLMTCLSKYDLATNPFTYFTENMMKIVKANPIEGLSYDKDMSEEDELAITAKFKGNVKAFAGSYPSIGRIAPSYVRYSEENQGRSAAEEIVGAAYAQGYMVGLATNDATFIDAIKPIYLANIDKPLLIERYDLFVNALNDVTPLSIVNKALPLKLTTIAKFDELVNGSKLPKKLKPKLSNEELTDQLLNKLDSNEHEKEEERKELELIDSIKIAQAEYIANHGKFSDLI